MRAYLINMEQAKARRSFAEDNLRAAGFVVDLVQAIDGRKLEFPHRKFAATLYALKHGKRPNPAELGCYLSHLKALSSFLESGEAHGLIVEDDISFRPGAGALINEALALGSRWDLLRLSGLHSSRSSIPVPLIKLRPGFALCIPLSSQTGAGAYIVNRRAALALLNRLLPMSLPFDHAFDQDWRLGIRSLALHPMPVEQKSVHDTQIEANRSYKYPMWRRYWSVLPYRLMVVLIRFTYRSGLVFSALIERLNEPAATKSHSERSAARSSGVL